MVDTNAYKSQDNAYLKAAGSGSQLDPFIPEVQLDGVPPAVNGLLPVGPDSLDIGPFSLTAMGTLFTQDMTGYESLSLQVTSAGSATITYEVSNDNVNWLGTTAFASTLGAGMVSTSTTALILQFSRKAKYFRARVTTYSSGTVTVIANLTKVPFQSMITITGSGGTTIGVQGGLAHDAAIASSMPIRVGGRARTSNVAAVANDDVSDGISTLVGALITKPFSIPEAEVFTGATPVTVTTSGQAVLTAGAAGIRNYATGFLITTNAAWTVNTIRILSNATVLAEFDLPAGAGVYSLTAWANSPLRTAVAEAMNVLATGAVTGVCKVNASGYQAP